MKNTLLTLLLLAGAALPSRAVTITYDPIAQSVPQGSIATVNVMASGLTQGQVIGAFDLTVQWNPALVSLASSTFSGALGTLTIADTLSGASQVNMASISLESPEALALLQAGQPFALFTLNFNTLALGTTPLTFASSPLIISDGDGDTIAGVIANTGAITITGGNGEIPEPSTLALLAIGLATMVGVQRRRK